MTEWLRNSEGHTRVTGGKHFKVTAVSWIMLELGNLDLGERLERKGVALGEELALFFFSGKGPDAQA